MEMCHYTNPTTHSLTHITFETLSGSFAVKFISYKLDRYIDIGPQRKGGRKYAIKMRYIFR